MTRIALPCSTLVLLAALSQASGNDLFTQQTAEGEFPGWASFHEEAGAKTADVWTLKADGVLVCKGTPRGYLYSKRDYSDVAMTFEWRWPAGGKAGRGGVLLRTVGEHRIWPKSLEVQLNAGHAGDFWAIGGYGLTGDPERSEQIENEKLGTLIHVTKLEAAEKPAGEWNQGKVVLEGGKITVWVNDVLVNRASNCDLKPGKIVLTAEGPEIHFRNIRVTESAKE